jgi:N-acyl-D-amino-acid deacylase
MAVTDAAHATVVTDAAHATDMTGATDVTDAAGAMDVTDAAHATVVADAAHATVVAARHASGAESASDMAAEIFDIAINGGAVADVVNGDISEANVGVNGDRVARVTTGAIDGRLVIDASGLIVSPGFIDFHSHVDGNPWSATCMLRQGGVTTIGGERSLNSRVIRRIEDEGFTINQGFSVSHSFVLRTAVGVQPNSPATDQQIRAMADLAERFLEHGAFGIHFGLELIPGTSYDEILSLSRVAKRYDRPILVHLRKDGREALQYFDEIIRVCEETGVKAHILHLLYMVGIGGVMENALGIIDDARAKGLDITADSPIYDAFTACIGTGIFDDGWETEYDGASAADLLICSGIHAGTYCDETLFRRLRTEHPETLVAAFVCDEEAIAPPLKRDYVYISTNAADGPHYTSVGAPEVAGTFPRLLGRHVRENGDLTMTDALRKITILPARRYGLTGAGSLDEGNKADITIFDPETIMDKADYPDRGKPNAPPVGIERVIINGRQVLVNGEFTDNENHGRLLWKR